MAKVTEDASQELPLNDERKEPKVNRHVNIAKAHLQKRGDALTAQINKLIGERDGINAAIEALK